MKSVKHLVEHTFKDIIEQLTLNNTQNISAKFLQHAVFFQFGSALFIKLDNEKTVLLTDFFTADADYFFYYAPESGLPLELGITAPDVYYLDSGQLGDFLQAVANDTSGLSSSNFDSLLLSTLTKGDDSQDSTPQEQAKILTQEGDFTEVSEAGLLAGEGVGEQGIFNQGEGEGQGRFLGSEFSQPISTGILAANDSTVNAAFAAGTSTPVPTGPLSISRVISGTDTLGATGTGLSSVSGDAGTLVSRASVDGLAGVGSVSSVSGSLGADSTVSSISGSLNNFQLTSVVPLSDAFPGEEGAFESFEEKTIFFDGVHTVTLSDFSRESAIMNSDGETIIISSEDNFYSFIHFKASTTDDTALDTLVFSDTENWIHQYGSSYKISGGTLGFFDFFVDDSTDPNVQLTNFYSPDFRHGASLPAVDNTNITRYQIEGSNAIDGHYAVSGAGDSDFIFLSAGVADTDTLSFFNKDNPDTGNGDYDLVRNADLITSKTN